MRLEHLMRTTANARIVRALNRLWEVSGMRQYCLDCIKDPKRGGCCHRTLPNEESWSSIKPLDSQPCTRLTPTGCNRKPLGCAAFMCHDLQEKFPLANRAMIRIKDKMVKWNSSYVRLGMRNFTHSGGPVIFDPPAKLPQENISSTLIQVKIEEKGFKSSC